MRYVTGEHAGDRRRMVGAFLSVVVLFVPLLLFSAPPASAAVKVSSYLDRPTVQLGERFIFEISVAGGNTVSDFDFSHLSSLFDIRPIDSRYVRYYLRNRGRRSQDEDEQTFFFRFIAMQTGNLQIGAIPLNVDGETYLTQTHPILVVEPEETSLFKLSASLSKETAYRGEPIVFSVTWYSRAPVRYYNFLFPILNHPDIRQGDFVDDRANDTLNLPFGTGQVPIERDRVRIDDTQFDTITFRQYIIPEKVGYYRFPRGTVQLWLPSEGTSFGYSGSGADFETLVLASESLKLRVLDLPLEGRPASFNGLVGENFEVTASASPLEVNVGDPIELDIHLSGPSSLAEAELPPLEDSAAFKDFAFLPQRAREKMEGGVKVFSRVIRARSHDVLEIPPVEIAFFNTRTGRYETVRSQPIPLVVRQTRVVTEEDLEGDSSQSRRGVLLSREKGIDFNFEGVSLLDQETPYAASAMLKSPLLLFFLIVPPGAFLVLVLVNRAQSTRKRRLLTRSIKRALRRLTRQARNYARGDGREVDVLRLWVGYLGKRLGYPEGALTYEDARRSLSDASVDEDTLKRIRDLFDRYEMHRYARTIPPERPTDIDGDLLRGVIAVTRRLERVLSP
jgi:hypothetical protein